MKITVLLLFFNFYSVSLIRLAYVVSAVSLNERVKIHLAVVNNIMRTIIDKLIYGILNSAFSNQILMEEQNECLEKNSHFNVTNDLEIEKKSAKVGPIFDTIEADRIEIN